MAVKINSGDLKHKVVFKQPTSSLNDEAGVEYSYDPPLSTVITWAAMKNIDIRRVTEAMQTVLIDSRDFYVRYSSQTSPIDKKWLIEWKSKNYTIHENPVVDEENKFIRITAKTRTDG